MPLTQLELIALGTELSQDFSHESSVSCTEYRFMRLEGFLHELSHLAVFNLKPASAPVGMLDDYVGELFENYTSRRAADMSELKAVAVELLVAKELGMPLDEARLLANVTRDCRYFYKWEDVQKHVGIWLVKPATQKRARRVLYWLQKYIKLAQENVRVHKQTRKEKRRALVHLHPGEREQDQALHRHDE